MIRVAKTFLSSDPIQVEAALRTHLAEVSLASQTLMRRCRDEQDLKCLSVIGRASLRLERMVHQFELARRLEGKEPINFPRETAMGALALYISDESVVNFQPMNINFGLIPQLGYRVKGKRNKNAELSKRALEKLAELNLT